VKYGTLKKTSRRRDMPAGLQPETLVEENCFFFNFTSLISRRHINIESGGGI
jgi:hypothetical protein